MTPAKPTLRSAELASIHSSRQSAIIATLLFDPPTPIPKHTLQLLRHAPESFDDIRYGLLAKTAFDLYINHKPTTFLNVKEALIGRTDLNDVFAFLGLQKTMLPSLLEWEAEELWNAYSFRQKATLYDEASREMLAHPDQALSIDRHVRQALESLDSAKNGDGLPEIICARNLLTTDLQLPDLLIDGLLHKGSKMSLGGGSKTFKSWTFINMAVAISTGTPWLDLATTKAKVLIVNFEIQPCWIRQRINTVTQSLNVLPEPGWLDVWNLRGFSAPHALIIPKIVTRAKSLGYGLIIIDPAYKLIGTGDENSTTDVSAMMNSFERIAVDTKAAVSFAAHYAKGNASQKEAIDRISGSGVFARDPDTILTFTPHEQPNCFTVNSILRNLPQMNEFVVEWKFPSFHRQPDLDPADLKKKPGRPTTNHPDDILNLLKDHPLSSSEWQKAAATEFGTGRGPFFAIKNTLEINKKVVKSEIDHKWHLLINH